MIRGPAVSQNNKTSAKTSNTVIKQSMKLRKQVPPWSAVPQSIRVTKLGVVGI